MRSILGLLLLLGAVARAPGAAPLDVDAISAAAGVPATVTEDNVVRLAWPRDDLAVEIEGTALPPGAGLTTVTTLTPTRGAVFLLGEVVLAEDEATVALDAALAHGLAVIGLETRMPWARPPILVLHLDGEGDAVALAAATRAVWDAARQVRHGANARTRPPDPAAQRRDGTLDTAALERRLGTPVRLEHAAAIATVPRPITVRRSRLGAAHGVGTRLWFSGSPERATVIGEIALAPGEVQAVVRALRAGGLHLTLLHGHLVGESPQLLFAGFRGTGTQEALTTAIRAVLDAQRAVQR